VKFAPRRRRRRGASEEVIEMQELVRKGIIRLIVGYAAIAFMLPYLALKIAWISGAPIGMPNKNLVAEPSMLALNILTFCMDAVAVLLALTFTHNWGLRAPAWPTLFPMWVGTGFLAPIAVAWPIVILARMLGSGSGQRPSSAPAMLDPWVAKMVYTSFACQGLALMTAFILYARARWGSLLQAQTGEAQPPRPTITLLGNAASVVAAAVGALHLLWAAGAPLGLPSLLLQSRDANFYLLHATFGLAALGAAAGIVMLVNRLWRRPLWFPLSLAWAGSGAMFSWGSWLLLATVATFSRGVDSWLLTANNVTKIVAGLLIGAMIGPLSAARLKQSRRYFRATSQR
ncbi:MAG: hypothetical protein ACREA2_05730, partial [Blastocatellia bacterium]